MEQGPRLAEDPWIAEAAAADGNAVSVRFPQETQGILRLTDTAASQNHDAYRVLDSAHDGPVGPADIRLGHAPRVNIDCGGAGILCALRHLNRCLPAAVRAAADFQRDGNRYRPRNCCHDT